MSKSPKAESRSRSEPKGQTHLPKNEGKNDPLVTHRENWKRQLRLILDPSKGRCETPPKSSQIAVQASRWLVAIGSKQEVTRDHVNHFRRQPSDRNDLRVPPNEDVANALIWALEYLGVWKNASPEVRQSDREYLLAELNFHERLLTKDQLERLQTACPSNNSRRIRKRRGGMTDGVQEVLQALEKVPAEVAAAARSGAIRPNEVHVIQAVGCHATQTAAIREGRGFLERNPHAETFAVYRWWGDQEQERFEKADSAKDSPGEHIAGTGETLHHWFREQIWPDVEVREAWGDPDRDYDLRLNLCYLVKPGEESAVLGMAKNEWFQRWKSNVLAHRSARNKNSEPLRVWVATVVDDPFASRLGEWTIWSSSAELQARYVIRQPEVMKTMCGIGGLAGDKWLWGALSVQIAPEAIEKVIESLNTWFVVSKQPNGARLPYSVNINPSAWKTVELNGQDANHFNQTQRGAAQE